MNTGNQVLDNLFNGLSSIYRTDNGMLNSNMYTVLNAEAEVFNDVNRKIGIVNADTYIATALPDALESNFGILVGFPKPPRLNTLTNGNEIYRAMLKSLFKVFQSGATTASMDEALSTAVSFLTIDPNTDQTRRVINYTHLYTVDSGIKLTWTPVQSSGGNIVGPARNGVAASGDIGFFPEDLIVTDYNSSSNTISFTGTVNTGTNYNIIYFRDNRAFNGNNWINLTNPTEVNVSPFNLKSQPVSTYDNPEFSYWWNNFNSHGQGVQIDSFSISGDDSSLVWRLPEKTIQFVSPYSQQIIDRTTEFYNESGTAYDIEHISNVNRDTLFYDTPINYYTDVPDLYTKYYIRYSSNNNGPAQALSPFLGTLPLFTRRYTSIDFPSSNFGQLDFFEKNSNFNFNDLFGTGTTNIWLNVPNVNAAYSLSNDFLFQRQFSLHQRPLFIENFESGQLNTIESTNWSGTRLTEIVGVPSFQKEDCMLLMGLVSGDAIYTSPKLSSQVVAQGNHVQIDMFDPLNSGTQTLIDITRTGTSAGEYNRFRFGIDDDVRSFEYSSQDPLSTSKKFGFVETFFENILSTDRTVDVKDHSNQNIVRDYTFSTGTNPNVLFSNQSMLPNGIVDITPNATSDIISNSDFWSVQFEDFGTSNLTFKLNNYKLAGTGNVTGLPFYVSESYWLFPSTSTSFFLWQSQTLSSFDPNIEVATFNNNGGISPIPYFTGLNTVTIIKGTGVDYNGTLYTGNTFGNPGVFWNTPGFGNGAGNQNVSIGDNASMTLLTDQNVLVDHYELGNAAKVQNYNNTLNQYSGVTSFSVPYFYQVFTDQYSNVAPKNYLTNMPRTYGWHTLTVDFGTSYTGTNVLLGDVQIFNGSIPFSGSIASTSGIQMITNTNYPLQEFSYFDNVEVSYYDPNQVLPEYALTINLAKDWEGSDLSESTIVDNKFFDLEPMPNFQFNVIVRGLDPEFIFIINKIIDKLKPAHTIATSIFEQDQSLDTTQLVPLVSSTGTDWETGNIMNNIIIKATGQSITPTDDLPGYITISGT